MYKQKIRFNWTLISAFWFRGLVMWKPGSHWFSCICNLWILKDDLVRSGWASVRGSMKRRAASLLTAPTLSFFKIGLTKVFFSHFKPFFFQTNDPAPYQRAETRLSPSLFPSCNLTRWSSWCPSGSWTASQTPPSAPRSENIVHNLKYLTDSTNWLEIITFSLPWIQFLQFNFFIG